jgi:hypothetical protein
VQVPLDTVVAPPRPLMILLACFVEVKPITSTASRHRHKLNKNLPESDLSHNLHSRKKVTGRLARLLLQERG